MRPLLYISVIFQPGYCEDLIAKGKLRNKSGVCGADNEIRIFGPLAITGLHVVEKISTHSYARFPSFG
jgi:hypothetical protein